MSLPHHSNRLLHTLRTGDIAVGCSLNEARDPGSVHCIAAAGADVVFIDLEHTTHSLETAANLVAHARGAGIAAVVRPPQTDYHWLTRLLDGGCQSLLLPRIRRPSDVERAVDLAFYHPRGHRGVALLGGANTQYQPVTDVPAAMERANENILVGVVIETVEALEFLDEILTPAVDLAVVGNGDLAHALGIAGQVDHPLLAEARARVRALCQQRHIAYGVFEPDPTRIADEISLGAQLIVHGGVLAFIRRGLLALRAIVDGAATPRHPPNRHQSPEAIT